MYHNNERYNREMGGGEKVNGYSMFSTYFSVSLKLLRKY